MRIRCRFGDYVFKSKESGRFGKTLEYHSGVSAGLSGLITVVHLIARRESYSRKLKQLRSRLTRLKSDGGDSRAVRLLAGTMRK